MKKNKKTTKEKKETKEETGEKKEKKKTRIVATGKRKTAIARAVIREGKGIIKINSRPLSSFSFLKRLAIEEPLRIASEIGISPSFDIEVNVRGGGQESQIEASRLAIARALLAFTRSLELKKAFLQYDRFLLVADVRRKEAYKPCDSKARAARQKSYR